MGIIVQLSGAYPIFYLQLEVQLHDLKLDYEEASLRNAELQKKLDAFTRDRRRVIDTLDLVTGDKRKAMETIKFLKYRVSWIFLTFLH